MIEKDFIVNLVEEKIADTGYFLVGVSVAPGNFIVVEIDHDNAVDIDYCVELSRFLQSRLPDRDIEDYELEVGSSGVTSPFKTLRQYKKNIGNAVEVLIKKGEKLKGVLKSVDEEGVVLVLQKRVKPEEGKRKITIEEDIYYKFEEIKYTKYLIDCK